MTYALPKLALAVALIAAVVSVGADRVVARDDGRIDVLVLDGRGEPLAGATVSGGGGSGVSDASGRVRIDSTVVPPVPVEVTHPKIDSSAAVWTGPHDRLVVTVARPIVRALHVGGSTVGTSRWDDLLALADRTAVNGFVLDIKDESGRVFPMTGSAWAHAAGAATESWDLAGTIAEMRSHDLRVVVRIVAFQDPVAGRNIPALAARSSSTGLPYSNNGQVFLDPTDADARAYAIELAVEACAAGVDEVQFDYVRFPDGFSGQAEFDGPTDEASRIATISGFLTDAGEAVGGSCAIAADVFGFTTSIAGDGGIGQRLEDIAAATAVVSPMVYPNHWSAGWFGFSTPADHPGPVAYASTVNAVDRIAGTGTVVRPWLQDFGGYGPAEVRAQIDAADSLGLGWMIWNAISVYTAAGLPTDAEMRTPIGPAPPFEQDLPLSGFWDVADTSTFTLDVAWMATEEITKGCNPPWRDNYCPDRALTRAETAAFLARALDLPAGPPGRFVDDDGSTHEADIERLAAAGITRGCGPETFCPDRAVTRAEMAAFLARALDLPAGPPGRFVDDDGSTHEADIERLAAAGITRGCGPETFCPDEPLRRDQMAAFLHRALA